MSRRSRGRSRWCGRRRLAFVVPLAMLAVLLLTAGTAAADEGSVPIDVTYATSPQDGAGNSFSAPYQWWKVALNKGDVLQADIAVTSDANDSVYLWLFLPGTTHKSQATKVATSPINYTATQTGDYLFCAFSFWYSTTSYTITWTRTGSPTPTPAKPSLTKLSPAAGKVGTVVTLSGRNFGSKRGTSYVKFGGKKVGKYVSWSTTRIKVKVPVGTAKGKVNVTVTTAAGRSGAKTFTRK